MSGPESEVTWTQTLVLMLLGSGVICGDLLDQLQSGSSVPVVCLPHPMPLHVYVVYAHMCGHKWPRVYSWVRGRWRVLFHHSPLYCLRQSFTDPGDRGLAVSKPQRTSALCPTQYWDYNYS